MYVPMYNVCVRRALYNPPVSLAQHYNIYYTRAVYNETGRQQISEKISLHTATAVF